MWYKDEANGSHIYAADSEDLYHVDGRRAGRHGHGPGGGGRLLVARLLLDARRPLAGDGRPALERPRRIGPSSRGPSSAFRESVPTTATSAATARSSSRAPRPIFSISPIPSGPRRTRNRASTALRSRSPGSSSGTGALVCDRDAPFPLELGPPSGFRPAKRPESPLELETSDAKLAAAFAWAKGQALDYVFPAAVHDDPVGDWYEAALPSRFAFCMRDVSHQATGAQALGLAAFNRNMLGKFARGDQPVARFLLLLGDRQVGPAGPGRLQERQGLLVQPAGQLRRPRRLLAPVPLDGRQGLYRGPGLPRVLSPDGQGLYRSLGQGRRRHPRASPGVRQPRARRLRRRAVLGPDGVSAPTSSPPMARAFDSYAAILEVRGEARGGRGRFRERAAALEERVTRREWWNEARGQVRRLGRSRAARSSSRTCSGTASSRSTSASSPPGRGATRRSAASWDAEPEGIEIESYLPEIFYRYGADEAAYAEILALSDPAKKRREYPEVPFAVIGAIATGLMGVRPDAADADRRDALAAHGRDGLGRAAGTCPSSTAVIDVRHDGRRRTTLHRPLGRERSSGRPSSTGVWDELEVDGVARKAAHGADEAGRPVSWMTDRDVGRRRR